MLTAAHVGAREQRRPTEARGTFESECPAYCGAQDTSYVGKLKGIVRIYQQTFVDTHRWVGFAKQDDCNTSVTGADLLNGRLLLFFEPAQITLNPVSIDRG